jgi:hypothetical protein
VSLNSFSHSIPSELGLLSELLFLYLHANYFTSNIPSQLGSLQKLNHLYLAVNYLTGTIPSKISEMDSLDDIYFNLNYLTGSIPPELGSLSQLKEINLFDNMLTGIIPSTLGDLSTVIYVRLNNNHLTGSIPSALSSLSNLKLLHLYKNHLHGKVSLLLQSMTLLEQLFIQGNDFTGNLYSLFSFQNISNSHLMNIDFSDNRFSGSIPKEIFQLPSLQTIALSSNCFNSKLPTTICEAFNVIVYSLDGLTAARDCKLSFSVPLTGVSLSQTLDGTIPDCLWSQTTMKVLNLAGNGLRGQIKDIPPESSLINLTLAHNYLTGTIPRSIQMKRFVSLDLSYNKLSGESNFHLQNMSAMIAASNGSLSPFSLILDVNRLSGQLSHDHYGRYSHLNILSGNIFSCNFLPKNDDSSTSYSCGSNEFDQSIFTFCALASLFLFFTMVYLILSDTSSFRSIPSPPQFSPLTWKDALLMHCRSIPLFSSYPLNIHFKQHQQSFPSTAKFGLTLRSFLSFLLRYFCLLIFLTIPFYILKGMRSVNSIDGGNSMTYATHTHMYRWFATVAFISGQLPAAILLSITFILLLTISLYLTRIGRSPQLDTQFSDGAITKYLPLRVLIIFIINLAFVGTANGLYIWSTLRQYSADTHIKIQISLAIFKSIWSFGILPILFPSSLKDTKRGVRLITLMNLMNTVILPCIVTALTSPSCYQVRLFSRSLTPHMRSCRVSSSSLIKYLPIIPTHSARFMSSTSLLEPKSACFQRLFQ